MTIKYKILRPPLDKKFDLPNKKLLLKLKPGDLVKLRFQVEPDIVERMWVIIEDCSNGELWSGKIDNDAFQNETIKILPEGKVIHFHPLDIIDIY